MQSYSATAEHTAMQPRRGGVVKKIAGMASLVALGAAGVAVSIYITPGRANLGKEAAPIKVVQTVAPQPDVPWVAAAPGRVEPRTGLVRISAGMLGRVTELFRARQRPRGRRRGADPPR